MLLLRLTTEHRTPARVAQFAIGGEHMPQAWLPGDREQAGAGCAVCACHPGV